MNVTYKQAAYILHYTQKHFMQKHFCVWNIFILDDYTNGIQCVIKTWAYILFFIPVHIIKLFACIWDGGLKEFNIEKPLLQSWVFHKNNCAEGIFERVIKVYKGFNP